MGPVKNFSRISSIQIQVNTLRFQLADLLEEEEEWSAAARVLMGISMDSGQRSASAFNTMTVIEFKSPLL